MSRYTVMARDGVSLSAEVSGPEGQSGIVFVHEFGGDMRTWDGAFDAFSTSFRCLRYAARGFRPSDVPLGEERYGQDRSTEDLLDVAQALGLQQFHLVGCSMGSFSSLMATLEKPEAILSLTLIGCSTGPRNAVERQAYHAALEREIALLNHYGGEGAVEWFATDPAYARMGEKQLKAWQAYLDRLGHQSVEGARSVLQTVHWRRPSLADMRDTLRAIAAPVLVIHGEEDHPLVLETAPLLEECLPCCRILRVPGSGHLVHLEEPELFRKALLEQIQTSNDPAEQREAS